MNDTKQIYVQELVEKHRKQESLKSAIGQCYCENLNFVRVLTILGLPGEECVPDELIERINPLAPKVSTILCELQELEWLVDAAQDDTKQLIVALTKGGMQ